MENEKMAELLNSEEFLKKITNLKTPEEVQKAFKDQGIDISIEEIGALGDAINAQILGKNLDDKSLSDVNGGLSLPGDIVAGGTLGFVAGTGLGLCLWGAGKAEKLIRLFAKSKI